MSSISQKLRNNQQKNTEIVNETITSPVLEENADLGDQEVVVAGTSSAKFPKIENRVLKALRAPLKEKTTSEIRGLLVESQSKRLKLLKPKTNENVIEQDENTLEGEPREFYTPTRCVRISSTLNDDTNAIRNIVA